MDVYASLRRRQLQQERLKRNLHNKKRLLVCSLKKNKKISVKQKKLLCKDSRLMPMREIVVVHWR